LEFSASSTTFNSLLPILSTSNLSWMYPRTSRMWSWKNW